MRIHSCSFPKTTADKRPAPGVTRWLKLGNVLLHSQHPGARLAGAMLAEATPRMCYPDAFIAHCASWTAALSRGLPVSGRGIARLGAGFDRGRSDSNSRDTEKGRQNQDLTLLT